MEFRIVIANFVEGAVETEQQELVERGVNLLVTLDRNYLNPLIVMLKSYCAVHPDCTTALYVVHSSLEEADFEQLERAVSSGKVHIHSIPITQRYFKNIPVLERIPEESFYRLLAFEYLPGEIDRCLYLDPDIYIRHSLLPFYAMDLGDAYLAAAGHMHGVGERLNKARLGLTGQERYFNSGVMLMNLETIRRDFTLETVLDCLEENAQRLIMGDQDMANLLFGSRMIPIDERIYNLDERAFHYYQKHEGFDLKAVEAQTAVIHYNGKYKPWLEGYKGKLDCFYPDIVPKGPAPSKTLGRQIKSICRITRPTKQQAAYIVGLLSFACICLFSWIYFGAELTKIVDEPARFRSWLEQFGPFDEIAFIFIRAVQTVIKFIPAEPLEIAAGYAWGSIPGMLYCVIGNLIGTIAILFLTKRFGQKFIKLFIPVKNMEFVSFFKNSEKLYGLLFVLYLIPGLPKDGFIYFAGLLPIKAVPFLVITGIARMPSVLSSTLCGAAVAQKQYGASLLIFAATIALAVLGGVVYRKYMKKKTVVA